MADQGSSLGPGGGQASRLELVAGGIIEAGWLVALVVVPLFYNVYSSRSYEPDKIAVFRSIVLAMVAAWVLKAIARAGRRWRALAVTADEHPRAAVTAQLFQPIVLAAGFLTVSMVLSAVLSVTPRVSWFGSYERVSGVWTHVSYFVFFLLVAAHLRTRRQWTRAAYAMVLTGSTVALYAVLQALGLDPHWNPLVGNRVYSSLGNPIFMAGYLAMTVFVTAWVIGHMAATSDSGRQDRRATRSRYLRLAMAGLALITQLAAIVLSQSRGPVVGLAAGGYVVFLIAIARLRARSSANPLRFARLTATWLGTVTATVGGLLLIVAVAVPESPIASVRDVPYIGRISTALDFESRTSQVRLEIWRSVVDRFASDIAVQAPGAPPDSLDAWRPLIGYGPETLRLITRSHLPPFLEIRNRVPDRAHNETFDVLATQGATGYAAWVALYGGILAVCLGGVGLLDTRRRRVEVWSTLAVAAVAGVTIPVVFTGEWAWSGVGLPTGLVAGLALITTVRTRPGADAGRPARKPEFSFWLSLIILGVLVAHVVEIHFGIAVAATRVHFWFFTALAVALARGAATNEGSDRFTDDSRPVKRKPRGKGRRRTSRVNVAPLPIIPHSFGFGILIAVAVATMAFPLTADTRADSPVGVIVEAFDGFEGNGGAALGAFLWVLIWVTVVGAALLSHESLGTRRRHVIARSLEIAAIGGIGYTFYQATRVASAVRLQRSDPLAALDLTTGHIGAFVMAVLFAVLALGISIAMVEDDFYQRRSGIDWRSVAGATALTVAGVVLVVQMNLHPIRADTLAAQGVAYGEASTTLAMDVLGRALELRPNEPIYHLLAASVLQEAAVAAANPADSAVLFQRAEAAIAEAIELDPLEADHRANMGRNFALRAAQSAGAERAALFELANRPYAEAVSLRPGSPTLLREYAGVLRGLGHVSEAETLEERAAAIEAGA